MVLNGVDYRFNVEQVGFTGIKLCKTTATEPHPLLFKDPLRLTDKGFMKLCKIISRFNGQYIISNGKLYVVVEDKKSADTFRTAFKSTVAHFYYLDITTKEVDEIWEF
jgi:hypothetical protein